ncbi:hypothetical protein ROP_36440 [Rhodococcus opacus B4]|uniref:Uncharacterized protein n=1 Tax=Rhodococcus opacus (strain B4) TaxID=632772 RepID=C1B888_RHOOB|nr:hypothetical protein ROP_36440 [Rhodococcus opacus B4]
MTMTTRVLSALRTDVEVWPGARLVEVVAPGRLGAPTARRGIPVAIRLGAFDARQYRSGGDRQS